MKEFRKAEEAQNTLVGLLILASEQLKEVRTGSDFECECWELADKIDHALLASKNDALPMLLDDVVEAAQHMNEILAGTMAGLSPTGLKLRAALACLNGE